MNKRHIIQWLLLPIVPIVIGLGWKYTWLGLLVMLVMFMGIIGAFVNGRYVCGNLCPRGAFFDRLIVPISPQRPLLRFMRSMMFRWSILVLLMGLMFYRLSQNFYSVEHWGSVFWLMCTATTLVGVMFAIFVRARAWCSFCPIGTLGKVIGEWKKNRSLKLDVEKCVSCRLCEKGCPINLAIISKNSTLITNTDCIKCGECVARCPRRALSI